MLIEYRLASWRQNVCSQLPDISRELLREPDQGSDARLIEIQASILNQFGKLTTSYDNIKIKVGRESRYVSLVARKHFTHLFQGLTVAAWIAYSAGFIWHKIPGSTDLAAEFLLGSKISCVVTIIMTAALWHNFNEAQTRKASINGPLHQAVSDGAKLKRFLETVLTCDYQEVDPALSARQINDCVLQLRRLPVKFRHELPPPDKFLSAQLRRFSDQNPHKQRFLAIWNRIPDAIASQSANEPSRLLPPSRSRSEGKGDASDFSVSFPMPLSPRAPSAQDLWSQLEAGLGGIIKLQVLCKGDRIIHRPEPVTRR